MAELPMQNGSRLFELPPGDDEARRFVGFTLEVGGRLVIGGTARALGYSAVFLRGDDGTLRAVTNPHAGHLDLTTDTFNERPIQELPAGTWTIHDYHDSHNGSTARIVLLDQE